MVVRKASIVEFKELWDYSGSTTYKYFLDRLESRNIEFWTIDNDGDLIGELYIFWNSEDKDEANGYNRAYLCAYRIEEKYQKQGLGSKLMKRVLERVKEEGYTEVTIGVDNGDFDHLSGMYNHYGFNIIVKDKFQDDHYLNSNGKPVKYEKPYKLLMNNLLDRTNVLVYVFKSKPFKILILRRNESPVGIWQPVSGGVEEGEKLLDTVKREVYEETGITQYKKIIDLNYSFSFYVASTKRVMIDYCFAIEVENDLMIKLSSEHDNYLWLSYMEAMDLLEFDENKKALSMLNDRII